MKKYNILNSIGNTPIVDISGYSPFKSIKIYAKLEGSNPGGSIKDRVALNMIEKAEAQGRIYKRINLIEATSGNTGIGLAMISALKGYRFTAVIDEEASLERKKILKSYGANLITLRDSEKYYNKVELARKMIDEKPEKYVMLDQYSNEANWLTHYNYTASEIIKEKLGITHFVAGIGTGGTIMGIGRRLKKHNKNIKIIGVKPVTDIEVPGLSGLSDFKPEILNLNEIDKLLNIESKEVSKELALDLMKRYGISAGISSGAALWGAIRIAKDLTQNNSEAVIFTVFPDRIDKYLSEIKYAT
jgi:cysteine synthase